MKRKTCNDPDFLGRTFALGMSRPAKDAAAPALGGFEQSFALQHFESGPQSGTAHFQPLGEGVFTGQKIDPLPLMQRLAQNVSRLLDERCSFGNFCHSSCVSL